MKQEFMNRPLWKCKVLNKNGDILEEIVATWKKEHAQEYLLSFPSVVSVISIQRH